MLAQWGLCDKITQDNGPHFSSDEFRQFPNDYTFQHVTSSPGFPQSNGEAERSVQIAKKILVQDDPSLGLMTYRATPVAATGRSPAIMMTQREMHTLLPCLQRNVYPKSHPDVRIRDARYKATYQRNFNKCRRARPLSNLQQGDHVRVKMDGEKAWRTTGKVQQPCNTPRSYLVETDQGAVLRRNGKHLQAIPERPAQTAAPNVLAYPETEAPADDSTPMVLTPPLLHSEKTFVEYIPEGVSRETLTDKTPLRRSSCTSRPVNRLISEM